jgi:RNA polymerase-binding transcription factor DksA
LLRIITNLEIELSKENSELQKITKKINIADKRLDETEYGVCRRRGTLISLQKMNDKNYRGLVLTKQS